MAHCYFCAFTGD